mgnify:CR=1 FL=1
MARKPVRKKAKQAAKKSAKPAKSVRVAKAKKAKAAAEKAAAPKFAKVKPWTSAEIEEAFNHFQEAHPTPRGELLHVNAFTLLVAVVLSAQATDAGVNKATPALFALADTPEKMVALGEDRVRDLIKTIGLFRTKAKNVIALSEKLIAEHGGEVPSSREELQALPGVDSVELAALYEQSGARALSVLTDAKYFKGSVDDLESAHQHVKIPCLRKEFIIDEYQIFEARAYHADAILLIVRILSDEEIKRFMQVARMLGMAALVETHNETEIKRAIDCGAHIIGINNRNLHYFTTDINHCIQLKKELPQDKFIVCESGVRSPQDICLLTENGIYIFYNIIINYISLKCKI